MNQKFIDSYAGLEILPIYKADAKAIVIFALTENQFKQALSWTNKEFGTKVKIGTAVDNLDDCYGQVKRIVTPNKSDVKCVFVLFINFDKYKKMEYKFFKRNIQHVILGVINHELLHLVEYLNYILIPKQVGHIVQEPKAYTMTWATEAFYTEYERQGYSIEFTKLPSKVDEP